MHARFLCLGLSFFAAGCASTGAAERLSSTWSEARSDGVLTESEIANVDLAMVEAIDKPLAQRQAVADRLEEGDWKGAAVAGAFSILSTAAGMYELNRRRNKTRVQLVQAVAPTPHDPLRG